MYLAFKDICEEFSLMDVHDKITSSGREHLYRKIMTPLFVSYLIVVDLNVVWYIILFPIVVLSLFYSFGNISSIIHKLEDSDSADLIENGDSAEVFEETESANVPVFSNTLPSCHEQQSTVGSSFLFGIIYSYLTTTFPNITFNIINSESISNSLVEVSPADNGIWIMISIDNKNYKFFMSGNTISESDKLIMHSLLSNMETGEIDFVIKNKS